MKAETSIKMKIARHVQERTLLPSDRIQRKKGCYMQDHRSTIPGPVVLPETVQRMAVVPAFSSGVLQARIPGYAELERLVRERGEALVKEKVAILIENLKREHKIDAGADIGELIKGGHVVQDYYERLFGKIADPVKKELVYHSVADAHCPLNPTDITNLKSVIDTAKGTVAATLGKPSQIENVFGTKKADAITNYGKINTELDTVKSKADKVVTTDYNGDDDQTFLGGYAIFNADKDKEELHIDSAVCTPGANSQLTVIHECAHLSSDSIVDLGYYGTPGFDTMEEIDKLNNAAHYEVVPGWVLGKKDVYDEGFEFKPNSTAVAPLPDQERIEGMKKVSDYLETAWSNASNADMLLRECRLDPSILTDPDTKAKVEEISLKCKLTVDTSLSEAVTLLDITLMQDIVRNIMSVSGELDSIPKPDTKLTIVDYENYYKTEIQKQYDAIGISKALLDYFQVWL